MPLSGDPFLERVKSDGRRGNHSPPAVRRQVVVRADEQRARHSPECPSHVIVELDAPLGYSDMLVPNHERAVCRACDARFLVHAANSSSGFWAMATAPWRTR